MATPIEMTEGQVAVVLGMTFLVCALIAVTWDERRRRLAFERKETESRDQARKRFDDVMARGGPNPDVLAEFLAVNPELCPTCGYGTRTQVEYETSWQGDIGASGTGTSVGTFEACARCGRTFGSRPEVAETYSERIVGERTVRSPYLSEEQQELIGVYRPADPIRSPRAQARP